VRAPDAVADADLLKPWQVGGILRRAVNPGQTWLHRRAASATLAPPRPALTRSHASAPACPPPRLATRRQVTREAFKNKKRAIGDRQKDTLSRLAAFQSKLKTPEPGGGGGGARGAAAAAAAKGEEARRGGEEEGGGRGGEEGAYDGRVKGSIDHRCGAAPAPRGRRAGVAGVRAPIPALRGRVRPPCSPPISP
jgi:hypothetical protein